MDVLLVLKSRVKKDFRVVVRLHKEDLSRKVSDLVEKNRGRDAMELVMAEGLVQRFIPEGDKLPEQPDLVLIEDLL